MRKKNVIDSEFDTRKNVIEIFIEKSYRKECSFDISNVSVCYRRRITEPWKVKFHSYVSKTRPPSRELIYIFPIPYSIIRNEREKNKKTIFLIWMILTLSISIQCSLFLAPYFFYSKLFYAHRLNIALVFGIC